MKTIINYLFHGFDFILVLCISVMFILVFSNTMMRIIFNSGIDISEELPRFMFIWLTFIGAIVALRENMHFGMDAFVQMMPLVFKKICWVLVQILMIAGGGYVLYGTYLQHEINSNSVSPVMRIPMIYVYGVTYITGFMIIAIVLFKLYQYATGNLNPSEFLKDHNSSEHIQ